MFIYLNNLGLNIYESHFLVTSAFALILKYCFVIYASVCMQCSLSAHISLSRYVH